MSLTDRDRKILTVLAVLAVVAGYWFLILSPKREEASKASKQLTEQRNRRDAAVAHVGQLSSARTNYASEYADLLRIGKAVPASVDMPSLLLQLDQASKGTGVDFAEVSVGARQPSAGAAAGSPPSSSGSGSTPPSAGSSGGSTPPGGTSNVPAAAGGEKAQSLPGKSAEQAGNSVNKSNAANGAAAQNGVSPQDTQTSQSSKQGGLPVGGGGTPGSPAASSPSVPGLDTVPLTFRFNGTYFELADFYHQLKRFVYVRGNAIQVKGRLMTIDGFKFANGSTGGTGPGAGFGKLTADVTATVYLVPKEQGVTAGASPQGPSPSGSGTQAVGTEGATPQAPVPAPTAAAKP